MSFSVRFTWEAEAELERLFDFVLDRDLVRDGCNPNLPEQALLTSGDGAATLTSSPLTCRKVSKSTFLRELIIPFRRSGYLALFEIEGASDVVITAVRHQLEDDYH